MTARCCLICDGPLLSHHHNARYCSNGCRQERDRRTATAVYYNRRRPKNPRLNDRKCRECGCGIDHLIGWKKFCSDACRAQATRKGQARRRIAEPERHKAYQRKWWRKNYKKRLPKVPNCVVCGGPFPASGHANSKTCSEECGHALSRTTHKTLSLKWRRKNREKINQAARKDSARRSASLQIVSELAKHDENLRSVLGGLNDLA